MATARTGRKMIEEFIIPRGTGKAFHLAAGQILRITAHEGMQSCSGNGSWRRPLSSA